MQLKPYNTYTARTLFVGFKIGKDNNFLYVGIPEAKGRDVKVTYKDKLMVVDNYDGFVKWSEWFEDKVGLNHGRPYRLAYFKWKPQE